MNRTIRDVAKHAGVSPATASRVLSGSSHPVTPEVRERVLHAALELDYSPNAFARGLSKQETRLIGLVVPNISEPYFIEIGRGAEDYASRHGYMVVMCNTDRRAEKEQRYVEELRALRAGILLVGRVSYEEEHWKELASHPAPVVVIGRHQLPCSAVLVDNVQGALDAVCHLIHLGHRRIAYLGGPLESSSAADRLAGFRQAMERHGRSVDDRLVVHSDFTMEGGAAAFRELLEAEPGMEAVFAVNDHTAIGVMHEARLHGLAIPGDLSIVGFNDVPVAAYVEPPLTTVHLPLRQMGEMAAKLLLDQFNSPQWEHVSVQVKGELVIRQSTAPARVNAECDGARPAP